MNPPATFCALLLLVVATTRPAVRAGEVKIVRDGERFGLVRDGQPYFVRGAGGDERLWERLPRLGGNSVRVWGDERLGEQLDAAHRLGLTLTAGIWLPQVRQGFDHNNVPAVAALRERVRATVNRHKDHPALLVWALGNEMEDPPGENLAVWKTINDLAALVKELDPHHPVMTVVAEIGGPKLANFQRLCPAVDILGVNSYAGAPTLGERYRQLGGTKPYLLTEFGPPGIWEIGKDALGAYPEPTSTEKARLIRRTYAGAVLGQPNLCLGSYAFLWGHKQEATATWFSLFLPDGARVEPVDALTEFWTGRPPVNRCPSIVRLALPDGAATTPVAPGATVRATLATADAEGDPLRVTWTLQRDPERYGTGGDAEPVPPTFPDAILRGDAAGATVRLPAEGGLYRLFATVRDDHGGAAVANVSVRVDAPVSQAKPSQRATLPLVVVAESEDWPAPYAASGWMGNVAAIRLNPGHADRPHAGRTSLRCEFQATSGWGGVAWQDPANDWGDLPGGRDLSGAKRLTFWARGERGGEIVNFRFGGIPPERKFPDTAQGTLDRAVLSREWQRFEIPAFGLDLSRVKTGFAWSVASPGRPVVFYLDDVRWE